MLAKYEFNRNAFDNFIKSIHPINKRNKNVGSIALEGRVCESPMKTFTDLLSRYCKSPVTRLANVEAIRYCTPKKQRTKEREGFASRSMAECMRLTGSPINIRRRFTPFMTIKSKSKVLTARLPNVKWHN
jgi:hypothetical protein